MAVHYLEVVTEDVDGVAHQLAHVHGVAFGSPDPDLGHARVAHQPDGTVIGVRRPLAAHEQPVVRAYVQVADIESTTGTAERCGATIAYPPTRQGEHGTFAIVIQGGVELGLWMGPA